MAHAKISRTTKSNQQTEVKDPLTLGQHLSAVLNSPNLPAGLHTQIWDALGDIPTVDLMDEPDFLDKLLKVGQEMAAKPKDGDHSEAEEESKTVTMTRYQYEGIRKYAHSILELCQIAAPASFETEGVPKSTLDLIGKAII
jgi:hypothetical protein